jgi:hypothetical protein
MPVRFWPTTFKLDAVQVFLAKGGKHDKNHVLYHTYCNVSIVTSHLGPIIL